jgi:transposase
VGLQDQRFASTYIFRAVCPQEGKRATLVLPVCNTAAMNLRLAEISEMVSPGKRAVLLLDQGEWHLSGEVAVPDNITLLPLPPKCPELNVMENVWQFMRDNWLPNRVFQDYDDIVDHCCHHWNRPVDQPWRIMSVELRESAHRLQSAGVGITGLSGVLRPMHGTRGPGGAAITAAFRPCAARSRSVSGWRRLRRFAQVPRRLGLHRHDAQGRARRFLAATSTSAEACSRQRRKILDRVHVLQLTQQRDPPTVEIGQRIGQRVLARPANIGEGPARPARAEPDQPESAILRRSEHRIGAPEGAEGGPHIGRRDARDVGADDHDATMRARRGVQPLAKAAMSLPDDGATPRPAGTGAIRRGGDDRPPPPRRREAFQDGGKHRPVDGKRPPRTDPAREPPLHLAEPRRARKDDQRVAISHRSS